MKSARQKRLVTRQWNTSVWKIRLLDCIVFIYVVSFFTLIRSISLEFCFFWQNQWKSQMTDRGESSNIGEFMRDNNNREKTRRLVCDKLVPDLWQSFWPKNLPIVDNIWLPLVEWFFKHLRRVNCLMGIFVWGNRILFVFAATTTNKVAFFTKNCFFITLVGPSETGKKSTYLQSVKNWSVSNKIC